MQKREALELLNAAPECGAHHAPRLGTFNSEDMERHRREFVDVILPLLEEGNPIAFGVVADAITENARRKHVARNF